MSRTKIALDFCISHRMAGVLQELYGHHGFEFLHLKKLVLAKTHDTVWADVYKRFGGRIVISGDCRIAYKPHEAVAFIDNGFLAFFPQEKWAHLKQHEKASALVYWWPAIVKVIQTAPSGTCWRIPCDIKGGELRLRGGDLEQLVIPNEILEEARRERTKSG